MCVWPAIPFLSLIPGIQIEEGEGSTSGQTREVEYLHVILAHTCIIQTMHQPLCLSMEGLRSVLLSLV